MVITEGLSAIMFDLDGTLRFSEPRGVDAFHYFAERLGFNASSERRRHAWCWVYEYWTGSPRKRIEELANGEGQGQDFWLRNAELHLRELGAPKDRIPALARGVVSLFAEAYQPRSVVPEDGPKTLAWLQEQGLILGVVSNRQDPLAEVISALGLDWAFQVMLAAGEVDSWKPDPSLLLHAASLAKIEPKATMYVGDNYFADVVGARAAGMRPVLFDPMDLFPEAECAVISSLGELRSLVENMH